ncbi:hypothetical protein F5X96DRAFT_622147, partial [Biscogniauxia mediterranea]
MGLTNLTRVGREKKMVVIFIGSATIRWPWGVTVRATHSHTPLARYFVGHRYFIVDRYLQILSVAGVFFQKLFFFFPFFFSEGTYI